MQHPDIERLLREMSPMGLSPEDAKTENICTLCPTPDLNFKNDLSRKEYQISGICQSCQDQYFRKE
mgnify:FL=1